MIMGSNSKLEQLYLRIKLTAQYELAIKRAQTPDRCVLLVRLRVIGRQRFPVPQSTHPN